MPNNFITNLIADIFRLANNNQGVVDILIFLATLFIAWATGIIDGLRRRPNFKIDVMEGPSLCSTFETGREYNGHKTHRTAIALYLNVVNRGTAASSIYDVHVGYRNHLHKFPFSLFWIRRQTIALQDFQAHIGDNLKVYPFLTQQNALSFIKNDSHLEVGKQASGVVYFEQDESWGGFLPRAKDGKVKMKVKIIDVFGRAHKTTALVPQVDITAAQRFNPQFGHSFELLAVQSRECVEQVGMNSEESKGTVDV
jgi:hypothetical protein